jgi:hypothetical protein
VERRLAATCEFGVGCVLAPMPIAYTAAGDLPAWSGFLNGLLGLEWPREDRIIRLICGM